MWNSIKRNDRDQERTKPAIGKRLAVPLVELTSHTHKQNQVSSACVASVILQKLRESGQLQWNKHNADVELTR